MSGRVIQYFFAAIFCVGVFGFLFHPQDLMNQTQPFGHAEISFQEVGHDYSSESCTISAAKTHNYSDFLLSLFVWEVEETDDEKEVSDFQGEKGNVHEVHNETTFVDFLRQPDRVSSVPLFIVLHCWKHFLS